MREDLEGHVRVHLRLLKEEYRRVGTTGTCHADGVGLPSDWLERCGQFKHQLLLTRFSPHSYLLVTYFSILQISLCPVIQIDVFGSELFNLRIGSRVAMHMTDISLLTFIFFVWLVAVLRLYDGAECRTSSAGRLRPCLPYHLVIC